MVYLPCLGSLEDLGIVNVHPLEASVESTRVAVTTTDWGSTIFTDISSTEIEPLNASYAVIPGMVAFPSVPSAGILTITSFSS